MKLDDKKTTLADLKALVGKSGRYRTALGWSQSNRIEAVQITADGIVLILAQGTRLPRIRHRHLSRFELDKEKPEPATEPKPKLERKKPEEVEEKKVLPLPIDPPADLDQG